MQTSDVGFLLIKFVIFENFIIVFGAGNPGLFRVGEECALLKLYINQIGKFVQKLKVKCKYYGIRFETIQEAYTSKCDHLANDEVNKLVSDQTDEVLYGVWLWKI